MTVVLKLKLEPVNIKYVRFTLYIVHYRSLILLILLDLGKGHIYKRKRA